MCFTGTSICTEPSPCLIIAFWAAELILGGDTRSMPIKSWIVTFISLSSFAPKLDFAVHEDDPANLVSCTNSASFPTYLRLWFPACLAVSLCCPNPPWNNLCRLIFVSNNERKVSWCCPNHPEKVSADWFLPLSCSTGKSSVQRHPGAVTLPNSRLWLPKGGGFHRDQCSVTQERNTSTSFFRKSKPLQTFGFHFL